MKQANILLALQKFCGDDISTLWKEDTNSMGNVMTLSKLSVQLCHLTLANTSFSEHV